MKHPPCHPKAAILSNRDWLSVVAYALIITISLAGASLYGSVLKIHPESGNNIVFYGLALAQLCHVFNMAPVKDSLFNNEITRNRYVWGALGICLIILLSTYYSSFLSKVLSIQLLDRHILIIILMAGI
jgi:P-type Ca2+ transporter type 2C